MSTSNSNQHVTLKRDVGLFGGISVLAGIMIGSGIFLYRRDRAAARRHEPRPGAPRLGDRRPDHAALGHLLCRTRRDDA